jgi:hypothetical protein
MKVLLIDADSKIPNLALMKLSAYYKQRGSTVTLKKLDIPYFPGRKKKHHSLITRSYDKVFCSVIYSTSRKHISGRNIQYGGSGVDLGLSLPPEVEKCDPDYQLYDEREFSYGFLSRGCVRNCKFCIVPEKEGKIRQVATVDDIVRHKKVRFLDNNFLALPNHKEILEELVNRKIKCEFYQGLDIRLIDDENSTLLKHLRYIENYTFAFDYLHLEKVIEKKLELMNWRSKWKFKFFVYCHPDQSIANVLRRIDLLRAWGCLPYIMRDLACWESEYREFYIDLAAYCNQPVMFKNVSFIDYMYLRYKNKDRINMVADLYYSNSSRFQLIEKQGFLF